MDKYLYNGVSLPDIYSVYTPELQATHPFAFIVISGSLTHLCITPNEPYIKENKNFITGAISHSMKFREDTTAKRWYLNDTGEWESVADDNYTTSSVLNVPTWANFDLLYEDGTPYLPVPVSPVKLNPALLVQGFLTGQALRRNRT